MRYILVIDMVLFMCGPIKVNIGDCFVLRGYEIPVRDSYLASHPADDVNFSLY